MCNELCWEQYETLFLVNDCGMILLGSCTKVINDPVENDSQSSSVGAVAGLSSSAGVSLDGLSNCSPLDASWKAS